MLIPAGYVTTVYDPVFALSADGKRYVSAASDKPTTIPAPGLPFSLVFRAEPGKEDVLLKIASAYEAASKRRVPPPDFRAAVALASSPRMRGIVPRCRRRCNGDGLRTAGTPSWTNVGATAARTTPCTAGPPRGTSSPRRG